MKHLQNRLLISGLVVAFLTAASSADLERNRHRLKQLSPAQMAEVRKNFEEFDKLPPAEKDRMRKLHADLTAAGEQRQALEESMVRYMRWLDTLTPSQRTQVESVPAGAERLTIVSKLIKEQNRQLDAELAKIPPSFRQAGNPGEAKPYMPMRRDLQMLGVLARLRTAIEAEADPAEKELLKKLEGTPPYQRVPLLVALANKYSIELPEQKLETWLIPVYMTIQAATSNLFGDQRLEDLPEPQKQAFYNLVITMYRLPPVNEGALLDFLEADKNENTRQVAQKVWERASFLAGPVMTLRYYMANKDKVPKELRTTLNNPTRPPEVEETPSRPGRPASKFRQSIQEKKSSRRPFSKPGND